MLIVVIGAGAIGGWLAARLALAGEDVRILLKPGHRPPARLVLRDGSGDETAPVRFVEAGRRADAPADLVIIATKAIALADASEAARAWIAPETLILPLQNGVPWWFAGPDASLSSVDPDGRIAAALPIGQVIGGVVHAAARRIADGVVDLVHADRLLIGEPQGDGSARARALVQRLVAAGLPAEACDDIRAAIWYKAWGNMTINPVSALTGATADRIVADPLLRRFLLAAMDEAAAIGAAFGCPIRQSGEDRLALTARLGAFKTSMLQDAEAGRRLEHEALIGAPRELARMAGVESPNLDLLHALIAQKDGSLGAIRRPE